MSRALSRLATLTSLVMFVVLLGGALVTSTNSADGCGQSWPLCHGQLIPQGNLNTWIEFSHRAFSGVAGILVVTTSIWAWRSLKARGYREAGPLALIATCFLFVQAGLGAMAVMWPQTPTVMAAHFGISLLSFAAVFLLTVLIRRATRDGTAQPTPRLSRSFVWLTWCTTIYTFIVVYTGAYVRHAGATLACNGWPLCNGKLIPTVKGLTGIHFTHRLAVVGVLVLLVWLMRAAKQEKHRNPAVWRSALSAHVLAWVQTASGALVALGYISTGTLIAHSAIVAALFAFLSLLCLDAHPIGSAERVAGSTAKGTAAEGHLA